MKYEIIWSENAGTELIEIISYIAYNSGKHIAAEVYIRIKEKIEKIDETPKAGRVVPELEKIGIHEIYQILEHPWKIYYRITENKIMVLSIIDGRRNLEDILYKKIIEGKLR